ncbi:MAG TPA: hypothetical protein VF743_06960, partial [Acidimicrobiales bacterium]
PTPDDHAGLDGARAELAAAARAAVAGRGGGEGDVIVETAVDCRYRGQSHELTVPDVAAFHDAHRRRNGYARPGHPVEIVAVRAVAERTPAVAADDLPVEDRLTAPVAGPTVLAEPDCTIWVPDGWTAEPGAAGAVVLRRAPPGARQP